MTITRDTILGWLRAFGALIAENKDYLTELDSAIGDADHGVNMDRGMQAVLTKLPTVADKDIGGILKVVGMTLLSTIGGTSGPLYGTFFLEIAKVANGKTELTLADWTGALEAGINGMIMRGKAQLGDKTMLDAFIPALTALREAQASGTTLADALQKCADAAEQGRDATAPIVAHKGRASYLGERSAGHQDPGATSAALLLRAVVTSLANG